MKNLTAVGLLIDKFNEFKSNSKQTINWSGSFHEGIDCIGIKCATVNDQTLIANLNN